MPPQLNGGTLIWNDGSSSKMDGFSTVEQADIRGSARAAFMVIIRRELPRTGLAR
jgi:hypothetical protein